MKRESVLSEIEKESIIIEKLIFHIIIEDEFSPVFLDEVILDENQEEFFKKRIEEAAQGTKYIFKSKSTSIVYSECKKIISDVNLNFLNSSKLLTSLFKNHHKKSMSDGVFVVALVSVKNERHLIFLIKIDHKLVYQYKRDGNKATLEKIKNTFIEDKKAIQKVALIDLSEYYSWDLLASERDISGIREYFKDFLEVVEKDDVYDLTIKVKNISRTWASINTNLLNDSDNPFSYKSRAITYLENHDTFDSESFINEIIVDDNIERKKSAKESLRNFLQERGIYGQTFTPSKKALTTAQRKNVGETAEGVTISWDGDEKDVLLDIPKERNKNDQLFHIVIKTSNLTIKK